MQCDMDAGRLRIDQALRIADGTAARTVEVTRFRLDLHRQVKAADQRRIDGDGCGERIMQWHACGKEACVGPEIGGDGKVSDIGKESQRAWVE